MKHKYCDPCGKLDREYCTKHKCTTFCPANPPAAEKVALRCEDLCNNHPIAKRMPWETKCRWDPCRGCAPCPAIVAKANKAAEEAKSKAKAAVKAAKAAKSQARKAVSTAKKFKV